MSVEDEVIQNNFAKSKKKTNLKNIEILKKEIKKLSYEESVEALESILANVQDENITLENIQINYIKGHILLQHCQELLQFVEQEIYDINPESLDIV